MVNENEDQDLQDLIASGVFHKEEGYLLEELALPIHEGNGTTKSVWDRILYPFRVWKQKRREAEIRRNIFK
jgi:hypothetical protein